jgi:hypothetical protein
MNALTDETIGVTWITIAMLVVFVDGIRSRSVATGEIWIAARFASDAEFWHILDNNMPECGDKAANNNAFNPAGWWIAHTRDRNRRAWMKHMRRLILNLARAVSDRENARQQDGETV